ncbi:MULTISPECIES: hypothetical protein [unclassified Nostoc]|uniref:hypothetical protein n=1 Tax=unclassified Nostoc TaxID=2593658 RepID=UPI00117CFDD8|nr:hypothetical protein [Nostoc sp. 'Peltigera malacea cyanobiont' DB3992]
MSKNLQVLALVLHLLQSAYYSLLITHHSLLIIKRLKLVRNASRGVQMCASTTEHRQILAK